MPHTRYSIPDFIADAKKVLATNEPLPAKKAALGEHLRELAKREDLLRFGRPIGDSDSSNFNWILHREGFLMLIMVAWLPGYTSPVHEHGDYYVMSVGYSGHDRWDVYERIDDRRTPGHAELKLVDQWDVTPGKLVWMPPPPRSIHSHNNVGTEMAYELMFTAAPPLPPGDRLIFDVERQECWPSYQVDVFSGDWPPRPGTAAAPAAARRESLAHRLTRRLFCPVCDGLQRLRLFPLRPEGSAP